MVIRANVPLSGYSTMRLGGNAAFLTEVSSVDELIEAWKGAVERKLPVIVIGEGSNIIWKDEGFPGLVIVNRILEYDLRPFDENTAILTAGAGENWDSVVERTVNDGFYSLAQLSLIPGTVGATPVQNVGAYGQEISNCMMTLHALDTTTGKIVVLRASDSAFGYRTSRYKTTDRGRFFITSVTFSLSKLAPAPPYYDSLQQYLDKNQITVKSPNDIRQAVIAIRSSKLPDPKVVANNGSFFANPILPESALVDLLAINEGLKYWHMDNGRIKVSAAWLLEQIGLKDYHDPETGMATWSAQPLVFVNERAKNTADLLKFKQRVVTAVKERFGITLEQEPELLP